MVELQFMEPHNPTSNKNNNSNNNNSTMYCIPAVSQAFYALSHLTHATNVRESYHFNSIVKAAEGREKDRLNQDRGKSQGIEWWVKEALRKGSLLKNF